MSTDPLSSSAGTSKPPLSSAMFPHSLSIATSSYPKLFPESDTTNMEVLGFTASNGNKIVCLLAFYTLFVFQDDVNENIHQRQTKLLITLREKVK